jgi:nitronate monooxygenase
MMPDLRAVLSIEHPILQAGMGGGLSGWELASAVSNAGGLGAVGFTAPNQYEQAIVKTRSLTGSRPFAANLLMPFVRSEHIALCLKHEVPVVTLFYGFSRKVMAALKEAGTCVIYQVGSLQEAELMVAAGADALIVQGHEAGGHIRGTQRLDGLLPTVRERFSSIPIIAAGGVRDADDVACCRSMGADGVSCGTRFLMTEESRAHDAYKQRLIAATETVATGLFGLGWPAPHRVVPNAATRKWCAADGREPGWVGAVNWLSQFGARLTPVARVERMTGLQSLKRPLYPNVAKESGLAPYAARSSAWR